VIIASLVWYLVSIAQVRVGKEVSLLADFWGKNVEVVLEAGMKLVQDARAGDS